MYFNIDALKYGGAVMEISTELLIPVAIMLCVEYAGYLVAFKPEKIITYYYGKLAKCPIEIKNKVNRLVGLTTMAFGASFIVAMFIPEYTFELMYFGTVITLFVVFYGKYKIIKKYEESQKNND